MSEPYVKPVHLKLKNHPEYDENWVQTHIAEDPSILLLGDLELRRREKRQPRAGRLDLLLQDPSTSRRYIVELQLGATDASHIIRTLEYWDIEKKRYPQYDHCAVLVAEDVTSRFLNVISLFNSAIPIIAIQMQAIKVGDKVTLVFTKVVDELLRDVVDDDSYAEPTDRAYWEKRATKETVGLADQVLEIIHGMDEAVKLKYNKHYIGLEKDGTVQNFFRLCPQKHGLKLFIFLPQTEEVDNIVSEAGFDTDEHDGWSYRLRLTKNDIESQSDVLAELAKRAYSHYWES